MKRPHLKDCPKCGKRAGCKDTRSLRDGRLRRRYRCACNNAWSTIEAILPGTKKGYHSTKLSDKLLRESVRHELQQELRGLLGVAISVPMPTKRKPGRPRKMAGVDIDAIHQKR